MRSTLAVWWHMAAWWHMAMAPHPDRDDRKSFLDVAAEDQEMRKKR